jgi:hypothetical protein
VRLFRRGSGFTRSLGDAEKSALGQEDVTGAVADARSPLRGFVRDPFILLRPVVRTWFRRRHEDTKVAVRTIYEASAASFEGGGARAGVVASRYFMPPTPFFVAFVPSCETCSFFFVPS